MTLRTDDLLFDVGKSSKSTRRVSLEKAHAAIGACDNACRNVRHPRQAHATVGASDNTCGRKSLRHRMSKHEPHQTHVSQRVSTHRSQQTHVNVASHPVSACLSEFVAVAVVVAVSVAIVMVIVMYVLVAIVARAIAMSPTQHAPKKNTFYQAMRRARARIYTRTSTEPCETPVGAQVAHAMGPAAFRDDVLDRLACGRVGWLDIRTIAWHATEAGAVGVADLALDPSATGSN
jgi:hypothetical protein